MGRNLYELLGVKRDATANEIKKSYHKKALDCHPDKETDPIKKEEKEKHFKEISVAYGVLSDERKRQIYDQTGETNIENHVNPSDIFANLFGGGVSFGQNPYENIFKHNPRPQIQPVIKLVNVTLKDIYLESSNVVEVDLLVKCEECKGNGCANRETDVNQCDQCSGRGINIEIRQMGPLTTQISQTCHVCKGVGEKILESAKCKGCQGERTIMRTKKFRVSFDAETKDNTKIVYPNKGNQARDHDGCGDLIFVIRVIATDRFQRQGDHLIGLMEIPLETVLLDNKINFENLDGNWLELNWDSLDPNQKYLVKEMGFKTKSGKPGDLIVSIKVLYPEKLTPEQKSRLKEVFSVETEEVKNAVKYVLHPVC